MQDFAELLGREPTGEGEGTSEREMLGPQQCDLHIATAGPFGMMRNQANQICALRMLQNRLGDRGFGQARIFEGCAHDSWFGIEQQGSAIRWLTPLAEAASKLLDAPLVVGVNMPTAERSSHVRWALDVWYLLTFNGMVGEGRAFLVDLVEKQVVRERDFQFRAG